MDIHENDILEIKFSGGGIKPEELSLNEIADKLKLFHDLIAPILEEQNPGIDLKSDYVGLTDIGNRSLSFRYTIKKRKELIIGAYVFLLGNLSSDKISNLPAQTIEVIEKTSKFNYKHKTQSSFGKVENGEFISYVSFKDDFKIGRLPSLKGPTTVYGYVKWVGNEDPSSALIKMSNGSELRIFVSRDQAISINLFSNIKVTGIGTWKGEGLKLTSVKANIIEPFENIGIEKGFEFLKDELGSEWNEIDNPKEFLS